MARIIAAIEGIDCSGKGEVCRLLKVSLDAVPYKTPPEHMREEQNHISATASDLEHYRYYLQVVRRASKEIATISLSSNVVIDRYWMTTVAYHRVMGINASLRDLGEIILPSSTVYLTVSPEVQTTRMARRGMTPGDKRMAGRENLIRLEYDKLLAEHMDTHNVIIVDTSNLTPSEVVGCIVSKIRQ